MVLFEEKQKRHNGKCREVLLANITECNRVQLGSSQTCTTSESQDQGLGQRQRSEESSEANVFELLPWFLDEKTWVTKVSRNYYIILL